MPGTAWESRWLLELMGTGGSAPYAREGNRCPRGAAMRPCMRGGREGGAARCQGAHVVGSLAAGGQPGSGRRALPVYLEKSIQRRHKTSRTEIKHKGSIIYNALVWATYWPLCGNAMPQGGRRSSRKGTGRMPWH